MQSLEKVLIYFLSYYSFFIHIVQGANQCGMSLLFLSGENEVFDWTLLVDTPVCELVGFMGF